MEWERDFRGLPSSQSTWSLILINSGGKSEGELLSQHQGWRGGGTGLGPRGRAMAVWSAPLKGPLSGSPGLLQEVTEQVRPGPWSVLSPQQPSALPCTGQGCCGPLEGMPSGNQDTPLSALGFVPQAPRQSVPILENLLWSLTEQTMPHKNHKETAHTPGW